MATQLTAASCPYRTCTGFDASPTERPPYGKQRLAQDGAHPITLARVRRLRLRKVKALCHARAGAGGLWSPRLAHSSEGRGREKSRTGGLLRGRWATGQDYGGPTKLSTGHTCCRSRHTMHVVSREPEMR